MRIFALLKKNRLTAIQTTPKSHKSPKIAYNTYSLASTAAVMLSPPSAEIEKIGKTKNRHKILK